MVFMGVVCIGMCVVGMVFVGGMTIMVAIVVHGTIVTGNHDDGIVYRIRHCIHGQVGR